jgi:hypothetical protein
MPFDHLLDFSRPSSPVSAQPDTTVKQNLRSLLASLTQPLSGQLINHAVMQLEQASAAAVSAAADAEENELKQAIISRMVVGLYSESLDICISQAIDAETEADWWADVVRSRRNVAWYLLQSIVDIFSVNHSANNFLVAALQRLLFGWSTSCALSYTHFEHRTFPFDYQLSLLLLCDNCFPFVILVVPMR